MCLTTGKVRELSSYVYRLIEDKSLNNVLGLCENLLDERKWELGVIAYEWAYKMKKYYTEETFAIFERWLEKYVTGWGDCDDFCTHAFGELLCRYDSLFDRILDWCNHSDFWVRRAAAVILIYPIRKGKLGGFDPLIISDKLMNDEHYLVLKGYGWMLKVLSVEKPDDVFQYLIKNKALMPRVSFRYAIERFDVERKAILMAK